MLTIRQFLSSGKVKWAFWTFIGLEILELLLNGVFSLTPLFIIAYWIAG
jgi:hypothetical protein